MGRIRGEICNGNEVDVRSMMDIPRQAGAFSSTMFGK